MKVIYDTQEVQMENLNIPQHVAIILDGNGRWAKKRHLPRNMVDRQGSKVVFNRELETPTGRSKCIDETAS